MRLIILSALFIINTSSFAINCGDFKGEFKTYGGHYYAITGSEMSFENAKNFASANGGYIAIPNNSSENAFIKSLIGGNNEAWIGIYDPNYTQNLCFTANCYSTNRTRFKTVKNQTLSYQNWDSADVENQFLEGDDAIDMYNKPVIDLLGEHWTLMSGNTGLWRDWGTHFMSGENPATEKAIIEFDTKPICYNDPSNVTDEITGRVCNSQVWDSVIGVQEGTTADCRTDINNIEYCPQSLAECGQSWDYENGYSVSGVGAVVDYTAKVGTSVPAVGSTNTIELYTGHYDSILQIKTYSNGKIELYSFFIDDWYSVSGHWVLKSSAPSLDAQPSYINKSFYASPSYIGNNKFCFDTKSSVQCLTVGVPNIVHLGNGQEVINITSNTDGTFTYRYHNVYNEPPDHSENFRLGLTCTDGSTPVNGMCTTYTCPSGYSDNGSNCKKNVNYTYYNYLCSAGYTATTTGGNVQKTDPNTSADNTATLDDPLNRSTPPTNNCKKEKFTCLANESRPCAYVDGKHQCSPFPCVGESDFERLGTIEGANDKNNSGWNNDGECSGTIHIFNGKDHRCRAKDKFFGLTGGGCCDKDKVFFGLVACKENEKMLAKKRDNDLCHKVGSYCSKELKFIGCIQTSESHCCFNSKLARIIHEQGRPQIGLNWGSGDSPNCRGFKPEEFQKLDMSKMNLSEAFEDIQISTTNISTITTHIQNKVNDINVTMSR